MRRFALLFLAFLYFTTTSPLYSQSVTGFVVPNGNWNDPLAWSAGIPGSSTIAEIGSDPVLPVAIATIDSGMAQAFRIELGITPLDDGTLNIIGSGSLNVTDAINVGNLGQAQLTIDTTGIVTAESIRPSRGMELNAGTVLVDRLLVSDGTANINGGSLVASEFVSVGAGVFPGDLTVSPSANFQTKELRVNTFSVVDINPLVFTVTEQITINGGAINQLGGTVLLPDRLVVGGNSANDGIYRLTGNAILDVGRLVVGVTSLGGQIFLPGDVIVPPGSELFAVDVAVENDSVLAIDPSRFHVAGDTFVRNATIVQSGGGEFSGNVLEISHPSLPAIYELTDGSMVLNDLRFGTAPEQELRMALGTFVDVLQDNYTILDALADIGDGHIVSPGELDVFTVQRDVTPFTRIGAQQINVVPEPSSIIQCLACALVAAISIPFHRPTRLVSKQAECARGKGVQSRRRRRCATPFNTQN